MQKDNFKPKTNQIQKGYCGTHTVQLMVMFSFIQSTLIAKIADRINNIIKAI